MKPRPTPRTMPQQPPELNEVQKLTLANKVLAADAAASSASLRALAAQQAIDAANAFVASLNVYPGWQLDPLTGVFHQKTQ